VQLRKHPRIVAVHVSGPSTIGKSILGPSLIDSERAANHTRSPPVPVRPCPVCGSATPRWLEASSQDAYVNYYRCGVCQSIWNIPKDDPAAPPRIITDLRADHPDRS
jgi:hypothetical protein